MGCAACSTIERHLLSFPPRITDLLFSLLPTETIVTLAKVSCTTRAVCRAYLAQVWNFYLFFRRWFEDPYTFRKLLRRANAVVSGSAAIQLLDRMRYSKSDLDIYVGPAGFELLKLFIIEAGYKPSRYKSSKYSWPTSRNLTATAIRAQGSATTAIVGVFTFVKVYLRIGRPRREKVVQIIITNSDPIQHIVMGFHSTVMNWITADEAVSLFPALTFNRQQSYITLPFDNRTTPNWVRKYEARGFQFVHNNSRTLVDSFPPWRETNDKYCLRYMFSPIVSDVKAEKNIYGKDISFLFHITRNNPNHVAPPDVIIPCLKFHGL